MGNTHDKCPDHELPLVERLRLEMQAPNHPFSRLKPPWVAELEEDIYSIKSAAVEKRKLELEIFYLKVDARRSLIWISAGAIPQARRTFEYSRELRRQTKPIANSNSTTIDNLSVNSRQNGSSSLQRKGHICLRHPVLPYSSCMA